MDSIARPGSQSHVAAVENDLVQRSVVSEDALGILHWNSGISIAIFPDVSPNIKLTIENWNIFWNSYPGSWCRTRRCCGGTSRSLTSRRSGRRPPPAPSRGSTPCSRCSLGCYTRVTCHESRVSRYPYPQSRLSAGHLDPGLGALSPRVQQCLGLCLDIFN